MILSMFGASQAAASVVSPGSVTTVESCPFPEIEEGPGKVWVWRYLCGGCLLRKRCGEWGVIVSVTGDYPLAYWQGIKRREDAEPTTTTLPGAADMARAKPRHRDGAPITCLWLWDGAEWQRIGL